MHARKQVTCKCPSCPVSHVITNTAGLEILGVQQ